MIRSLFNDCFFFNKIKRIDRFLILPVLIFSLLYLPFIDSIPFRDGGVEMDYTYSFYLGGFEKLFSDFGSVHPPLKVLIATGMFNIFGENVYSYNFIGFIFGIIGIFSIYYLSREIFSENAARFSSIMLSSFPMFLAVGIFSLSDYIMTTLFLLSMYLYSRKNYIGYAVAASLAVLTKETGLIIPLSVVAIEVFYNMRIYRYAKKILLMSIPLIVAIVWLGFLKLNSIPPWQDYIFTDTSNHGSFYTVLNNIFTLEIFNEYAYQNWAQLFFLNFNWFYWIICILGICILFSDKTIRRISLKYIKLGDQRTRTLLSMAIFSLLYFFCVLSFQTWTIPRYALVMYSIMIMIFSISLEILTTKRPSNKFLLYPLVVFVLFVSLFMSLDPISIRLWGITNETGQTIYDVGSYHAGPDGMTYNMQYLLICQKRTRDITNSSGLKKDECIDRFWVPLSIDILNIYVDESKLCN